MRPLLACLIGAAIAAPPASAAELPIDNDYFESKVRPILVAQCFSCHGKQKAKGDLRLDSREAMLRGAENGPALRPGQPDQSPIIKAIRYDGDIKMPKKGKLADGEIAILTAWVKGGAPWPKEINRDSSGTKSTFDLHARARAQWAFQPIRHPVIPKIADCANPIDAFLLEKLRAAGLGFSQPAAKRVLLRRISFDLIGLPPTAAEMDAFLKDDSPGAYEKVVDRLLASPHYGERWGRHWLDLVRYAETFGHEFDFEIRDSWRYRDYVVRAFNADVPYNQFLIEHIAGDLLDAPRRNPQDGANESIAATGFWWLGESKHSPVDSRGDYADRTDNQIDVFGKVVLGLTLACARCHDHKFDPIATRDYYALFGVLASSRFQRADVNDPAASVKLLDEIAAVKKRLARVSSPPLANPTNAWREKATPFESFGDGWRKRWDADGLGLRPEAGGGFPHTGREVRKLSAALLSPTFVIDKRYLFVRVAGRDARARLILNGIQLIQDPIYGRLAQSVNHGEELRWLGFDLKMWKGQPAYLELLDEGPGYFAASEAWFSDEPPPGEPAAKVSLWAPNPDDDAKLLERLRELEEKLPEPRRTPAMRDGAGRNERIFIRGNHKTPGAVAPRAFLEAFAKPAFSGPGSGRLELARDVADPANPLVARVLVNRLWMHHFGEGIVRSPDNFGLQGQRPTHPELLDWLASEFVSRGWSVKQMQRLIVTSAAYRQASTPREVAGDPQNKLLHRQNVRRLEAEAIRDSMLLVSGRLDRTMEGPGVLPYLTEHQVGRGRPASGPLDGNGRRSIYLQVRRNFLNPMFVAFDYPTPFTTIGRRTVSNVPAQALTMLNNPFVIQQADLWAKRVQSSPGSVDERIRGMYLAAFGRQPERDEEEAAAAFIADAGASKAWADLAHVLFNAKEFIFVE